MVLPDGRPTRAGGHFMAGIGFAVMLPLVAQWDWFKKFRMRVYV